MSMRKDLKSGFTIVEMLVVIAVLAVLTGIISTAASSAIRQARSRRAAALLQVLQSGIATYHVQKGKWPGNCLENWSENGVGKGSVDYLSDSDYDSMMADIVKTVKGANPVPVMDVTGLIVCSKGSVTAKSYGLEFNEAVKKHRKHGQTLQLSNMAFGYQDSLGYFRRFIVRYNGNSDDVTVLTQDQYRNETGKTWPAKP